MANTTFMDVITNHAMVEISDIRMQREMEINPARFFRKMSFYLLNAIPRFNRPPEAREWLKFTAPVYDDFDYTVPEGYDGDDPLLIDTGKTGYEMVSAVKISPDGYGGYEFIPIRNLEYNSSTGEISIADGVALGDNIAIDFYTDGYFDRELDYTVLRILGLLVQVVWENRFANDFLIQQPKIKDRSFDVGNEANYMRATSERMRYLNEQVNQELKRFEQNAAYNAVVLNDKDSISYPNNQG